MDEIIKKLISIDKQARKSVSRAKKDRAKAVEELDKRKIDLREKNEEEFKKFIALNYKECENELDSARKSIDENKKQAIDKLDALYNEKNEEWINEIFNAVTQ